ncbi:hypothetical protein PTKIN_Ptkin19aG0101100 [Pterospermum kingtungense]
MGRMIPLDGDPMIIHPVLPFSLMVFGMVATIAIITGLCGFRKKDPPETSVSEEKSDVDIALSNAAETTLLPPQEATISTETETEDKTEEVIKELPPPPCMRATSCNNFMTKSASKSASNNFMIKSASTRKLTTPLSMKHVRSISVSKIREKTTRPKPEESVWTKTIILGEKCKVSHDDEDGGVIYNGKGNAVTAYHPRTLSTVSMSRTNSLKDPDTVPDQDKDKKITRKEGEDS